MEYVTNNKVKYNNIINKGFYINKVSDLSLLCMCVRKIPNVYKIMKNIIDNDPSQLDEKVYGFSPLMLSCINCKSISSIECAQFLIDNRADINTIDDNDRNCLMNLCRCYNIDECVDLFKILILNGIDKNHIDCDGKNILDYLFEKQTQCENPIIVTELVNMLQDCNSECPTNF